MATRSAAMLETTRRRRFTADEYQHMGAAGVFPPEGERLELLDGEVVVMTPQGVRHANCVDRLNSIFASLAPKAAIRAQGPFRLDDWSEPEPDLLVLAPPLEQYGDRPPKPEDVLLLVEVADSTLAFDRREKLPRYSKAGIPEVWIVNLKENRVEIHRAPEAQGYRTVRNAARAETVTPAAFPDLGILVDKLIP